MNKRDNEVRTVNEWIDRHDLEMGYTILNAKFQHDYRRLRRALRKQTKFLFILGIKMGNHRVTKMLASAKKQSQFCAAVLMALNDKKVEGEHFKVFTKDVESIEKRLKQIERITKEDVHLSEWEPFFLSDEYDEDMDYDEFYEVAKAWNESHKEIVKEHMKEIQPEIDRHNEFLRRKAEKIRAEKEAEKKAKKEQKAYEDEIINNRRKNRQEYRKIERSFERYYEGRA